MIALDPDGMLSAKSPLRSVVVPTFGRPLMNTETPGKTFPSVSFTDPDICVWGIFFLYFSICLDVHLLDYFRKR